VYSACEQWHSDFHGQYAKKTFSRKTTTATKPAIHEENYTLYSNHVIGMLQFYHYQVQFGSAWFIGFAKKN